MTAGERERRHREWVANGGPARAAALRAGLPPAVLAAREAMIGRTAPPVTLRMVDAKLKRMVDAKTAQAKRQAELRQRARTLLEAIDHAMLERGRRRLAGIRNREHELGFELTGLPPTELR